MPYYCRVIEAAEILNMSAADLIRDKERIELMEMAFSYKYGTEQGKYARECNAAYHQQVEAAADKIKAAKR